MPAVTVAASVSWVVVGELALTTAVASLLRVRTGSGDVHSWRVPGHRELTDALQHTTG